MNENMDRHKRGTGRRIARMAGWAVVGVSLAVLFALVLGIFLEWLWNWLMPGIFGLPAITYWQAFGLLVLARLLFGRFGVHHPKPSRRHPLREAMEGERPWHRPGRHTFHQDNEEAAAGTKA
jgi:hypothetical protein